MKVSYECASTSHFFFRKCKNLAYWYNSDEINVKWDLICAVCEVCDALWWACALTANLLLRGVFLKTHFHWLYGYMYKMYLCRHEWHIPLQVALLPQLICKGFARRPFCPSLEVVLGLMAPQETVSVISRCYLSAVLFRWHHAALHRTRRYLSSPAALGRSREAD